jgi:N-acetyl-1-D-myo-inositol-2-amino-2-deoxy-alpha-D-glucopyranoside deacetylase
MVKATFAPRKILLVHAHPDDESLFTGHVMADALARGAEVYLLTLTRGERGKVKLNDLKSLEGRNAEMGAFRTAELMNALDAYTISSEDGTEGKVRHSFAGTRHYLDSGMRINALGKPTRKRILDEMSLVAVATPVIADDILKVMDGFRPDAVVTYNSRGGFGHPDHKKAYDATTLAIRKYAKNHRAPQLWTICEPGERGDVMVGGKSTAAVKKAALSAHASQVLINDETYALAAGKETRFDAPERLRKANVSSWNTIKPWLRSSWAIPLGFVTALVGTMLHLSRTTEGMPIGLVLALLVVGAVALALRILRRSRGALYLMALTFIVTVLQFAHGNQGGSQLVTNSMISEYWLYGSIGLLAVIVVFPRIQKATWNRSASGHR